MALGILEFFNDAVSFNLNDEFGKDSLYLCSSIEKSFGLNNLKEIKLLDYEAIFTGRQLKENLSNRKCFSNDDCVYNQHCGTTCLNNTCTFYSPKPQLVNYCIFLRNFFNNNPQLTKEFNSTLSNCLELDTLKSEEIYFGKNESPIISFDKYDSFKARDNYWKSAENYGRVIREFYEFFWKQIKFVTEKTRKTTKTQNVKN